MKISLANRYVYIFLNDSIFHPADWQIFKTTAYGVGIGVLHPLARSLNGTGILEDTLEMSKTKNVETLRTKIPLLNHYPRETRQEARVRLLSAVLQSWRNERDATKCPWILGKKKCGTFTGMNTTQQELFVSI